MGEGERVSGVSRAVWRAQTLSNYECKPEPHTMDCREAWIADDIGVVVFFPIKEGMKTANVLYSFATTSP